MYRFAAVLILLVSGCGWFPSDVVIHPITNTDIFRVKKGEKVTRADGKVLVVVKDGWVISDYYMKEVMRARVKARQR